MTYLVRSIMFVYNAYCMIYSLSRTLNYVLFTNCSRLTNWKFIAAFLPYNSFAINAIVSAKQPFESTSLRLATAQISMLYNIISLFNGNFCENVRSLRRRGTVGKLWRLFNRVSLCRIG